MTTRARAAKCVHRKCRCTYVKFHRQTAPVGPGHPPPNALPHQAHRAALMGAPGAYPDDLMYAAAPAASSSLGGLYILNQSCGGYGSLTLRYLAADGVTMLPLLTRTASDTGGGTNIYLGAGAVVDISLAQGGHCLFHATTHSGTTPDNDAWVARKRATVLRFGVSSWNMHVKFQGDEAAFAAKYALGARAPDYAIHGGAWPLRLRGVDGVVAVVVVSGLKQDQDHGIIVQVAGELLEEMGIELGEKKKED